MSEMLRSIEWDKTAGSVPVEAQDLSHPYVQLSASLIDEEVNGEGELLDSFYKGDLVGVVDGLGDVLKVVCQMCYALDINPEELLKEINDSNFSKFCTKELDAAISVAAYNRGNRYKDVFYEKVDDLWVIRGWKVDQDVNTATPKVLKGINYREPDLQRFIK